VPAEPKPARPASIQRHNPSRPAPPRGGVPFHYRKGPDRCRPTRTMLDKVRNIGIMAHVDAGKTTTTERILYYSGTKHKIGDVDEGNTTTDFDPLEKQKGITINSAAVSVDWGDNEINIIDTPGHVDFTAEVQRSLRVLDGAVGVFCAVGGVEVQSETVWRQANEYKVPRLAFVNKLDRMGADFWGCVGQIRDKLFAVPAVVTIPAGQDAAFEGIIDLIRMKFILRDTSDPTNRKFSFEDVPAKYKAEAEKAREALLDTISAASDELTELVLDGKPVPEGLIRRVLREGTLGGAFTPVHCGSAKMYQGVQQLLDLVVDCLPSPLDRPPVEGTNPKTKETVSRKPDPKEPLAALAFKTVADPNGDLVYVRVYSGELKPGETYQNTTVNKTERIARFFRMMGDKRIELEAAGPGDIVAAIGLKQTYTGHTLCDQDAPVALESITFPKPVISAALSAARSIDAGKLGESLGRLVRDDPTLKAHTDEETKELILSGMGELHLEVSAEKLRRALNIPQSDPSIQLGRPRVAYRQTLSKPVDLETRYIKQTGGRGKFAVINVKYKPLDQEGIEDWVKWCEEEKEKPDPNNIYFKNSITQGVIPKEYIPSVEEGFRDGCKKGAKYGFPCVDIEAELHFGKYHDVDSSQDAFYLAAQEGFRDAQERAGITLLEPVMKVVVVSPKQYQGPITGDINRRRGIIEETSEDKGVAQVMAKVPLAELFGYTSDLRSATAGTASFSMEFSHYAPVREELADLPKKDAKK
jgi:elongation factor G